VALLSPDGTSAGRPPVAGPLRVAWLGPTPTTHSGVTFAATLALLALCERGVRIDCFVPAPRHELPERLRERPEITFVHLESWWQWGRWYSRSPLPAMLSGLLARAMAQWRLAAWIARRHEHDPYDVVYQFAQIELLGLSVVRRRLPPIVLHPGTHAAGELRWHRREAPLARRAREPRGKRALIQAILAIRALVQRRDMRRVRLTVALSRAFARHLVRDYRLEPGALAVVAYPIELERFQPVELKPPTDAPVTVLYISSIAVRKGAEMVVELSRRLVDLEERVRIEVVGAQRQWSDYRPLLRELDPRSAHWWGELGPAELAELYRRADMVVQPSHYEPFALTVAEALASGIPVVASDEVGATEGVDRRCCRVFPAGDADAFEAAVRGLVAEMRTPEGDRIRAVARAEAERLFARRTVGAQLLAALERAAGRRHGALQVSERR
jgi:glycosyltransferase involved in cell wall biosynthesis